MPYAILYFSGLKNDHVPETFLLRHEIEGNPFPCRYIKIGNLFVIFVGECHMKVQFIEIKSTKLH